MTRVPSPLHRDPDVDPNDWGVYTKRANRQISLLVQTTIALIESGQLTNGADVVDHVRTALQQIPAAADTIVKENVFLALEDALSTAGVFLEPMAIYGW